ncbi:hypothetical protein [Buttiauxella gaviniae]|uniref:hypothetical protein n=1 Tax=Buttiauxella gaviniae TaxID=82990 RepID=UPI0039B07230
MTTNRGLEQTLSDERLELFISKPLDNGLTRGEQMELAREALARRKASKEVYGYVNKAVFEMTGSVGLSNDHEHCADSPSYIPLYAAPPLQAVTVPDGTTDDERLMEIEGISVVKLPTEFHSEHGVVVQLEKVMAALAVHGIKYERRHQKVVGLRAGIDAVRAESIDIDAEKINAEKCHK